MKIMSLRNGGDLVNNSSCGLVVYRVTTIPSWHNFHITETQFTILYLLMWKSFKAVAVGRNGTVTEMMWLWYETLSYSNNDNCLSWLKTAFLFTFMEDTKLRHWGFRYRINPNRLMEKKVLSVLDVLKTSVQYCSGCYRLVYFIKLTKFSPTLGHHVFQWIQLFWSCLVNFHYMIILTGINPLLHALFRSWLIFSL